MAKQRKPISRPKTGLRGAPTESFQDMKYYFHADVEKKAVGDIFKNYVKSNYTKEESDFVLQNPEWAFTMYTHYAAAAYWATLKLDTDEKTDYYINGLHKYIEELIESGKVIKAKNDSLEELPSNVFRISPQDKLRSKVHETIFEDIYDLEDRWENGDDASFDLYTAFKAHILPTTAISMIAPFVTRQINEYQEVYDKDDKQLVEAYSHLSRKTIKHRLDQYKKMADDLEKLKTATKAIRQPRIKKPKAIDKQIAKVQFKKEDNEFKIASINPVKIVGAFRLYTFNTKTRALTELVTEDINGFEISGTSIKNFDSTKSRSIKLRKPDEFLKIVLSKTPKQIDAEWSKLTTKTAAANGRLNADIVLLKAFAK